MNLSIFQKLYTIREGLQVEESSLLLMDVDVYEQQEIKHAQSFHLILSHFDV